MAANPAHELRLLCRQNSHTSPTSGHAPGHIQANLLVLPRAYASDFESLCRRNPVPCPLLATGTATSLSPSAPPHLLTTPFDLRTDLPRYNIYRHGKLVHQGVLSLSDIWEDDTTTTTAATSYVSFLIGCSFSFEGALEEAGLPPRHVVQGCNVSMFNTTRPLNPAGVFTDATYVVSMRPYKVGDVERVRDITRRYGKMHGEPIAWGWEAVKDLGIKDLGKPDFGDAVEVREGEVPVFWGCGVTPQVAVMAAGEKIEGTVMAHMPGHMLVLDVKDVEFHSKEVAI